MENIRNYRSLYLTGAIATILVLCGIVADMVIGTITGGNIVSLPHTAIERFMQFRDHPLLGLYNLDLLNVINQIILIPGIVALYIAHRKTNEGNALLAIVLFLVGTAIFVTGNTALTMLDLSKKYFSAPEDQRLLIAAAGETMLAKGSHGNLGVFIGFFLPTAANLLMSYVMLKGNVFLKANAWTGLIGNFFMLIYIILVTFSPALGKVALLIAMPGGLLIMAWMIMYIVRLIRL